MKKIFTAVLLSCAIATPAFAAGTPIYAGIQVGDSYVGGFGGYQIDKMFSVEAHYIEFDSVSTPSWSTDISSIGVAGVAMFPMNFNKVPPFSFFAKAGIERTTAKTVSGTVPSLNRTIHDTDLTLGGGAQYDFNKNVSARVGVDVAGEADSLYFGAIIKF